MRILERHPIEKLPKIERSAERDGLLSAFLTIELEDALTARRTVDKVWNEARRQYNGVPKRPIREVPVPNAPNIEVTVGAILADDIYSMATDALFTASPLVTVRPVTPDYVEHAKAFQDWINWLVTNELGLRSAVNNAFLDDTQLGTGAYYIPFIEQTKKDRVFKVTYRSPRIFAVSPEDLIIPPGSRGDIQRDRWAAIRFWFTKGEMEERARERGWDITGMLPTAQFDLVRLQHERKANMRGAMLWREVFEVVEVYCYFDYDGDGLEEDLLVSFDRTSRKILSVSFNPYDTRPIEVMRYQLRSHLPYGLGVMEMVQPFQEEMTELHTANLLNTFLANARLWAVAESAYPNDTMEIMPGSVKKFITDDIRKAIAPLQMAEVYPSATIAQQAAMSLAERRIGTQGAAGFMAKGGSRTPGVTAMSLLQQANRRFAPAFDDMREKTGAAVRQAVFRYRERIRMNDKEVEQHIVDVMGDERALLITELMRSVEIENALALELTASTASVNREADRQNAILLSQLLGGYYQQTAALAMQAAASGLPPEVRALLLDIANKGKEMMDRTIRTFDQVRDPNTFLLDTKAVETALTAQQPDAGGAVLAQILQSLGGQPPEDQAPQESFAGVA
jgi:hypothetical protein